MQCDLCSCKVAGPAAAAAFALTLFAVAACSLTCRTFDIGLAEVCHMEGVSLLAYSPLAMGLLTVSRYVILSNAHRQQQQELGSVLCLLG